MIAPAKPVADPRIAEMDVRLHRDKTRKNPRRSDGRAAILVQPLGEILTGQLYKTMTPSAIMSEQFAGPVKHAIASGVVIKDTAYRPTELGPDAAALPAVMPASCAP
jgi:hypothetical protein